MDLKAYIRMELDGVDRSLQRVTDSLTPGELKWQPATGCNSIGLILFHIAKSEDAFVQGILRKTKEVWETGEWYKKLKMDIKEAGAHYTVEQVNAFPVPELKVVMEYAVAVRTQTLAYLDAMKPEDFDKKLTLPHFGEVTVASIFSLTVSHNSQHVGEISYLRGLQRGMDK
jgi:uncharacterized damage-inducible protein DinB